MTKNKVDNKEEIETATEALYTFCNKVKGIKPNLFNMLEGMGFIYSPASTKYHGNFASGLLLHSRNVALSLVSMTEALNLKWQRPESPEIVGWLHDICKIDSYEEVSDGIFDNRKVHRVPFGGHGSKSVFMLQGIIILTTEEAMCIRFHMGAYETQDWQDYDEAIRLYPNVLWTHTADMVASKLLEK